VAGAISPGHSRKQGSDRPNRVRRGGRSVMFSRHLQFSGKMVTWSFPSTSRPNEVEGNGNSAGMQRSGGRREAAARRVTRTLGYASDPQWRRVRGVTRDPRSRPEIRGRTQGEMLARCGDAPCRIRPRGFLISLPHQHGAVPMPTRLAAVVLHRKAMRQDWPRQRFGQQL